MADRARITTARNRDFPAGYPWPWTATLQVWDDGQWITLGHEDGDTRTEAVDEVRGQYGAARTAVVA